MGVSAFDIEKTRNGNSRYEKHWSGWLNRDMEFKIYGSCGLKPVIFIPCQAGRFWDF